MDEIIQIGLSELALEGAHGNLFCSERETLIDSHTFIFRMFFDAVF
jgi:hypothetical protein